MLLRPVVQYSDTMGGTVYRFMCEQTVILGKYWSWLDSDNIVVYKWPLYMIFVHIK